MPKCTVNAKKCLKYSTRDLKCASKSNPWYNGDCLTWEKFRGKTMNSRLHFKISTSSFQTKLFCLCTRALRGNRLHRPFRAATGDIFSPFSPRPPTPHHRPPAFHSRPNLHRQLTLPQIHSRTLSGAGVLTPAVCPLFGVKPTSTAVPNTRRPTPRRLRLLASHPRAYRSCNPRLSCGPAGFALRNLLVTALHRGEAYFLAIPLPISFRMFPNWL
jgi:hypothetical protein